MSLPFKNGDRSQSQLKMLLVRGPFAEKKRSHRPEARLVALACTAASAAACGKYNRGSMREKSIIGGFSKSNPKARHHLEVRCHYARNCVDAKGE